MLCSCRRHFADCLGILCLAFTFIKDGLILSFLMGNLFTWVKIALTSFLLQSCFFPKDFFFFFLSISLGFPTCIPYLQGFFYRMFLDSLHSHQMTTFFPIALVSGRPLLLSPVRSVLLYMFAWVSSKPLQLVLPPNLLHHLHPQRVPHTASPSGPSVISAAAFLQAFAWNTDIGHLQRPLPSCSCQSN